MYQVLPSFSGQALVLALCFVQSLSGCADLRGAGETRLAWSAGQTKDSQTEEKKEEEPLGRQNPVLREYFRKEYQTVLSSDLDVPDPFVEVFVDRRIDDYLERLGQEVDTLKQSRELLAEIGNELSGADGSIEEMKPRLRRTLEDFEETSDKLRKMVSRILLDLDSKSDFKPPRDPVRGRAECVRDIEFLVTRTDKALSELEQFFFSAGAVVHVADLQNQNMLTYLFEANRMARDMKKGL